MNRKSFRESHPDYQPQNTAASLKEKIHGYIDQVADQTDQAKFSEALQSYVMTASRFHQYSLNNVMLIFLANPEASQVAGFHDWQTKFHRVVKKGEHGIPILAPLVKKDEDDPNKSKLVGFKVVYVFDIAQTDGDPLPEEPDWRSHVKAVQLENAVTQYAATLEIVVKVQKLQGADGYSTGGTILLDTDTGTSAYFHEIAHELLHKGWEGRQMTREEKELEAEATAAVVSAHFGLDSAGSPNYLALWGADSDKIHRHLEAITNAAQALIEGVEKAIQTQPEPEYA